MFRKLTYDVDRLRRSSSYTGSEINRTQNINNTS